MDFNTRYRPTDFAEVLGQQKVVRQLRRLLHLPFDQLPHAYLFNGPTGVGKTSVARIFSSQLKALPQYILEIDGARTANADLDKISANSILYAPPGDSSRVLIIDEAQEIDKSVWHSLLKAIEETPRHLFWIFCSTDDRKIPDTIKKGRLHRVDFRAIPTGIIERRLLRVMEQEKSLSALPAEAALSIASASGGSLRHAYSLLEGAQGIENLEELEEYLVNPEKDPALRNLMQQLVQYPTPKQKSLVLRMFRTFSDYHPEVVRVILCKYLTATILNDTKGEKPYLPLLLMEIVGKEYHASDGFSELLSDLFVFWAKI